MVHTINTINEDRQLLPKIKIRFSIRDTCSTPGHGLDQAFHFVQRSNSDSSCRIDSNNSDIVAVSGVIGGYFSRVSIDLANLLRLYKVPQISYISTADVLGEKSRFDYFFRTVPPDTLQSRAVADIIDRFNWTYVFALHTDDTYGNGGIEALIKLLKNKSICVAEKIPLSLTAKLKDYDDAIQKMSKKYMNAPTVAVLFSHIEAANGIMEALQQRYERGDYILENLTWIGTDSWGDSLKEEYRSVPGAILSILQRAERYNTFDNYYLALSPQNNPRNIWFREFWEHEFNCSLSNASCEGQSSSMTLNTTDYRQINHLTLISDAVYAFAHAIHGLVQKYCTNQTLCDAIMEKRALGMSINGEMLRNQLYNISFKGDSSNTVYFDRDGENKGSYFIKNLKKKGESYVFEKIGTWDHQESLIFTSPINWPHEQKDIPRSFCSEPCPSGHKIVFIQEDCCWHCSPCTGKSYSNGTHCVDCPLEMRPNEDRNGCEIIPFQSLTFSTPWSIIAIILAVTGLITTGAIGLIFGIFYKHRAIKASSREVSAILLAGLALCYIMPFLFIANASPAVCTIRRFGVGLSFTVCFSALLIKTNRIYRIFNQKKLDPSKPPQFTSPLSQVLMTLALITVQVVAVVIWTSVDHPSAEIEYVDTQFSEKRCNASPYLFIAVSLGYSFVILILSTYNAFLARKVPENFNEARYINATLYALCIIWLAFVTIYFATIGLGEQYQAICLMFAIILSASATLICIFIPRLILLFTIIRTAKKNIGNTTTCMTNKINTHEV